MMRIGWWSRSHATILKKLYETCKGPVYLEWSELRARFFAFEELALLFFNGSFPPHYTG